LSELVETGRSTRTVFVFFRLGLLLVNVVEKRSEDLPGDVELIVANKVGVITLDGVEDEGPVRDNYSSVGLYFATPRRGKEENLLVSLGDLEVRESSLVSEIHFGRYSSHRKSRSLRIHLEVDCFSRLDTNDELVAGDLLEDTLSDILVLNTDLSLLFVEGCYKSTSVRVGECVSEEEKANLFQL
jgi:hypothetical protein